MRIFATGTSGTIGRALKSDSVTALDFRNWNSILKVLSEQRGPVSIIHLAAVVGANKVLTDPSSHDTNVVKTKQLLEQASDLCDLHTFVFASTGHVYENSLHPVDERSNLGPTSLYAQQKLEAENALMHSKHRDKVTVARIFSVLGLEGDKPGTLGARVMDAIRFPTAVVIPNALDVRDFLTPEAVGKYLLLLARYEPIGIVNVASGTGRTVQDFVTTMAASRGFLIDTHQFLQTRSGDPSRVADISKLKRTLASRGN